MTTGRSLCAMLFLAATILEAAAREPAKRLTVEDIRACSFENLVDRGSIRSFRLTTTGRDGASESLRVEVFWKAAADGRTRVNVHVVEPAELAGTSLLLLPTTKGRSVQFAYLPHAGTAGTTFDYGDLERLRDILGNASSRRGADATVAGRRAFVIETATPRIVSYVDRATCVPLRSELYSERGELEKVLETDVSSLVSVEPRWLALRFTLRDLRDESTTTISLGELYLKERLPESLFAPESFQEEFD